MDYNNVAKALQQKYSTNVSSIYVPSLGRSVDFRSVTVGEQKTITKIMLDSGGNQYKIYQGLVGLIKNTCLDESFDISMMNELDRIKILVEMYRSNFFNEDVSIKCDKCSTVNTYKIDFDAMIKKIEEVDVSPITETIGDVSFTIEYPNIVRMGKFYKDVASGSGVSEEQDIYDQFISSVSFDGIEINMLEFTAREANNIICMIPQEVLYGDGGVVEIIKNRLLYIFESLTEDFRCPKCNEVVAGGVSVHDFFI